MVQITDDTCGKMVTGRRSVVSGAAQQLTATSVPLTRGVQIKADPANAGVIYVGNSTATANAGDTTDGFPLAAGEPLFVPIDDLNKAYVAASASTQKYWFMAI